MERWGEQNVTSGVVGGCVRIEKFTSGTRQVGTVASRHVCRLYVTQAMMYCGR